MKKSWVIRKDETAVSPVIATILMVAITVVLAAVLYVMVTGLLNPQTSQPPTLALTAAPQSGSQWKVDVTVDRGVALSSFQVSLTNESGGSCIAARDLAAGSLGTCGAGSTLTFVEVAGTGDLTTGDYFQLTNVVGSNTYTLRVIWKGTDAVIGTEIIG